MGTKFAPPESIDERFHPLSSTRSKCKVYDESSAATHRATRFARRSDYEQLPQQHSDVITPEQKEKTNGERIRGEAGERKRRLIHSR